MMPLESDSRDARRQVQTDSHSPYVRDSEEQEDTVISLLDSGEEPLDAGRPAHGTPARSSDTFQTYHTFSDDVDVLNESSPPRVQARSTATYKSLPDHSVNGSLTTRTASQAGVDISSAAGPMLMGEPGAHNDSHRLDLAARNSLREMILSAILSDSLSNLERVSLLEDIRGTAEDSQLGLPFREILNEPMEELGVSPLMYEVMGCQPDWDGINDPEHGSGLEMVHYLIENWTDNAPVRGNMGVCMNVVRTACLRRFDEYEGNRLFQCLRPIIMHSKNKENGRLSDYDISIALPGGARRDASDSGPAAMDFTAVISIPHFASRLAQPRDVMPPEDVALSATLERKPSRPTYLTHVSVEFLASSRAWRLKVDSNALALQLLNGPGFSEDEDDPLMVDARVKIILPVGKTHSEGSSDNAGLESDTPPELLLPRSSLRPVATSGSATSEAKLSPCFCGAPGEYDGFRGLDDQHFLHDGREALLLELTVRFGHDDTGYIVDVRREPLGGSEPGSSYDADNRSTVSEDDLYICSQDGPYIGDGMCSDESSAECECEWEEVSQEDETESKEGSWVKASWSGKDEEL